jgi:hypothetical protein
MPTEHEPRVYTAQAHLGLMTKDSKLLQARPDVGTPLDIIMVSCGTSTWRFKFGRRGSPHRPEAPCANR